MKRVAWKQEKQTWCSPHFPADEANQEGYTEQHRDQYVSGTPWVLGTMISQGHRSLSSQSQTYLIPAPLHSSHEQHHTRDTEQSTEKVNLANDFHLRLAGGVDSRRWVIEKECEEKPDAVPNANDDADIAPVGVV